MGLGFCFVNGCKNNQGSLKKNDDNDKQSVGSEKNPGFFDCSTITKKADDENEGIQKKNKMYLETLLSNCECENVCYIKRYECYSLHVSVLWKRKTIFMLCNYIIWLFCIHPNRLWLIFPFKMSSKIIRVLTYDIKNKSNVHT